MRYLAIDYGLRHTGLAICDAGETICSPLTVIDGAKGLIEKIVEIVKNEEVNAIVLGLPLNMDGSQGPQAELVLEFAQRLKEQLDIPLHLQDERLTTFSAEEKMASMESAGRKKKKKRRLDAIAAAEILEAFLEQKRA
jgi:putative Holliday junction resolvase